MGEGGWRWSIAAATRYGRRCRKTKEGPQLEGPLGRSRRYQVENEAQEESPLVV